MARTPGSTSTPQTKAAIAFVKNLKSVSHMVAFAAREISAVKTATIRRHKTPIGDLTKGAERAKTLRSFRRFNATLQLRLDRFNTAMLWQVVVLVTCIEAYLHDVLVDAATVDVKFMSKSKQVAPYAAVVSATSLDELANELRRRWAHRWLSKGGPTRWISRLGKMGATGYPAGLAPRLELIWGIRHLTVHAAGVADAAFLEPHPDAAKAVGDRVRVSLPQFGAFLAAAREFLDLTDGFFLARCPSLLAATSSEPVKVSGRQRPSPRRSG